jgi:hypothetical protein
MGNRSVVGPCRVTGRDFARGLDAVHLITDPDPERVESEGLHAGVDLAVEELAEHALQAATRRTVRCRQNLLRWREGLALGKFHDLASDAASDVRNA